MMNEKRRALTALICSMVIYGTVGVFRVQIGLPSSLLAMLRGFFGAAVLLFVMAARRKKPSLSAIGKNLPLLAISGGLMGFNWILLFEAYAYTTVATATLCYYMAPVFLILLSPLALHEKLTWKKISCVAVSLLGMVLISGALTATGRGPGEFRGVALGLSAAVLYAAVVLLNKKMRNIEALDRTVVQLLAAGVVLLPYVLSTEYLSALSPTPLTITMTAVVCIVHTGLAYTLYFGSIRALPAHTLAILSYLDPVVAVLLSALLLNEPMPASAVTGAALLIGSAVAIELPERAVK